MKESIRILILIAHHSQL